MSIDVHSEIFCLTAPVPDLEFSLTTEEVVGGIDFDFNVFGPATLLLVAEGASFLSRSISRTIFFSVHKTFVQCIVAGA